MKIGSLLISNDYLIRNNKLLSGVILEIRDDLWGKNYRVYLSNGIQHWMDEGKIRDFFIEVEQ